MGSRRNRNRKSAPDHATTAVRTGVVYARVSSREQAEGYSIDAQLKLLKDYARQKGIRVLQTFVEVESAGKVGRPQFSEMINTLRSNLCRIVIVEKTDRLVRNFRDSVDLSDSDAEVHLVKEGEVISNESSSHELLIYGLKVLLAKNYLDNLSEEVRKGQQQAISQGAWPHALPMGYRRVNRRIEPDGVLGSQIAEMFRRVANGDSLDRVKEWAREQGVSASKRGLAPIGKSQIERIIKNPFYKGFCRWKNQVTPGNHPPLVSPSLWNSANDSLQSPAHAFGRSRKDRLAFHGLMTCGTPDCGCAIVGEIKKQGKYKLYRCTHARKNCTQGYSNERDLDDQFAEIIRAIQVDAEIAEWIKRALKESLDSETAFHRDAVDRANRQLEHVKSFKNKIYLDHVEGLIDRGVFTSMMENYREQERSLEETLANHRLADTRYLEDGAKILELAQGAENAYKSRSPQEKKALLKIVLSNAILFDKVVTPVYRQPFGMMAEIRRTPSEKEQGSDPSEPCFGLKRG